MGTNLKSYTNFLRRNETTNHKTNTKAAQLNMMFMAMALLTTTANAGCFSGWFGSADFPTVKSRCDALYDKIQKLRDEQFPLDSMPQEVRTEFDGVLAAFQAIKTEDPKELKSIKDHVAAMQEHPQNKVQYRQMKDAAARAEQQRLKKEQQQNQNGQEQEQKEDDG